MDRIVNIPRDSHVSSPKLDMVAGEMVHALVLITRDLTAS
jgi:hypothetical protein